MEAIISGVTTKLQEAVKPKNLAKAVLTVKQASWLKQGS